MSDAAPPGRPTRPGWYWWRVPRGTWICVEVRPSPEHGMNVLARKTLVGWVPVTSDTTAEWNGPLEPPADPVPKIGRPGDPWAGSLDPDHQFLSRKYRDG